MNIEVDITDVVLTTPDLILRPFESTDLDDFYEYCKVDGVGQMAGWFPHKNKEESKERLDHFINGKHTFALVKDNKVIGSLGIEEYDEELLPELKDYKAREIGYVLSKDYWGQGLMKQAVDVAIKYLFEDLKVDVIVCRHSKENNRSKRVQEKCGFKPYRDYIHNSLVKDNDEGVINLYWYKDYNKE